MIAQNIAYAAVQTGYTVLLRTAAAILTDLHCDSPQILRRRLQRYARPDLLVIDELAYLSYDDNAADLLYELVSRRYERRSIVITCIVANVARSPPSKFAKPKPRPLPSLSARRSVLTLEPRALTTFSCGMETPNCCRRAYKLCKKPLP
jgi:hypothetical protein